MIDEFKTVLKGYANQIFPDAQSDADVSNAVDKLCQDAVDNAAAEWDRFFAKRDRERTYTEEEEADHAQRKAEFRAWKLQRSTRARDEDSGEDEKEDPPHLLVRVTSGPRQCPLPTGASSPRPAPSSTTPTSATSRRFVSIPPRPAMLARPPRPPRPMPSASASSPLPPPPPSRTREPRECSRVRVCGCASVRVCECGSMWARGRRSRARGV